MRKERRKLVRKARADSGEARAKGAHKEGTMWTGEEAGMHSQEEGATTEKKEQLQKREKGGEKEEGTTQRSGRHDLRNRKERLEEQEKMTWNTGRNDLKKRKARPLKNRN